MERSGISWWLIAAGPIVGLILLEVWLLADGYNGHCGLLDAGWECSKFEYLSSSLLSPLLLPVTLLLAIGWLAVVGVAALLVRVIRRRRHEAT
jgi:putative effector of murein hydrolase LrgA (UPF0299 family)